MMLALPSFTPARFADVAQARDRVYCADLFALCDALPDQSIDMILADLPYGTTACAWDTVIPFEPMWARFKRVIKPRGAIVLTASQPFTSALVMSNPGMFKYSWVWVKNRITGFANAKKQPLRRNEDVLVFNAETYFPQGVRRVNITCRNSVSTGGHSLRGALTANSGKGQLRAIGSTYKQELTDYPDNILSIDCEVDTIHGTQKPVDLFRYLIRTYTRPGDTVLDPVVGSGTTAMAAREEQRHYICGDSSPEYVAVAQRRLTEPYTLPLFAAAGD